MGALIIIDDDTPASRNYEGRDTPDTGGNSAVMDFTSTPFGTAGSNRVIKLLVYWAAASSGITIVEGAGTTIGGVQAEVDHQAVSGEVLGSWYYVGIISAAVPTGTSGAVQITFSSIVFKTGMEIHSYSVRDLLSATPIAINDFSGLPNSDTLNVLDGGIALFGVASRNSDTAYTLTGVTEDYDANWFSNTRVAAGSTEISSDNAAYSVGADTSGTGVGTMASYR